jgi:vancomycin resistance protein YoaR
MHPPEITGGARGGGRGNEEAVVADEGAGRSVRARAAVIAGSAAVAVGAIAYLGAALTVRDQVPEGATVAGVPVGGLDRAAAVRLLSERLAAAPAAVEVRAGERSTRLDRAAAGLAFDPEETVDDLVGAPLAPGAVWRRITGTGAATGADTARLTSALAAAATRLDVPARPASVTFTASGPMAADGSAGVAVDVPAATRTVATSWLSADGPLALPTRVTEPPVARAEADRALAELARPAASGPLTVVVQAPAGARRAVVPAAALVPALRLVPEPGAPGRLTLGVDADKLRRAVLSAAPGLESTPQDARIVLRKGTPTVVPEVPGVTLERAALATAARRALLTPDRRATVPATLRRPALTTEKARALGVRERVSTFSTVYPPNADRTTNLRIAARTVNGTLVLPGQTFSLNAVLGRRTPQKGYRQAPVIEGTRLVKDYGGGVSQVATTIFNAVFFAGLQDVRHQPHSFYISRYPEGREATVSFPTVDLVWRNDSPYGVLVEASVTSTVNVSFWSTKVWDIKAEKGPRTNYRAPKKIYDPKPSCVPQGAVAGFDVVVRRLFYKGRTLVKTQSFTTAYSAEDEVICGPDPAKDTPEPPPETAGG